MCNITSKKLDTKHVLDNLQSHNSDHSEMFTRIECNLHRSIGKKIKADRRHVLYLYYTK